MAANPWAGSPCNDHGKRSSDHLEQRQREQRGGDGAGGAEVSDRTAARRARRSTGIAHATEYAQIWNELIQMPCNHAEVTVEMPLLELEPWQVVDVGFQVSAPFDRTWSCLEGGSEPCWACKGCRARESAFQQSGKADPLRVVRKI